MPPKALIQKNLTLAIAILLVIGFWVWFLLIDIIFAADRADEWYYWGISTMSYTEVLRWQANEVLGTITVLSLPFHLILSILMFVCYAKLRKGKQVSNPPYLLVGGYQIALILFAAQVQLSGGFGLFWGVQCSVVVLLAILAMRRGEV